MTRLVFLLLVPLTLGACATGSTTSSSSPGSAPEVVVVEPPSPEEVRAAQLRKQGREIEELRKALEADRARSEAAAARSSADSQQVQSALAELEAELAESRAASQQAQSELRALEAELAASSTASEQAQSELRALEAELAASSVASTQARSSIQDMEAELAEVRVRTDAATAQSEKAVDIATEFLSNLIAAREDQRSIVERNITEFDRMEQRLQSIDSQIADTQNMSQSELAATRTRSSEMEKQLEESEQDLVDLREQLLLMHRNNEETRAAIDSGPMLDMLRELEGTQRDTSGLRGALEEMQAEQESARRSMQNYYLDLDARIQDLQEREKAAREAEARLIEGVEANESTSNLSDGVEDSSTGDTEIRMEESTAGEDTVQTEPSVSTLPENDSSEAYPLVEEISAEPLFDIERAETESAMPGDASLDDFEVNESNMEESVLQMDLIEAMPLAEETSSEPPLASERTESDAGMPAAPGETAPGETVLENSDFGAGDTEEAMSPTEPVEAEASSLAEEISAESFSDTERVESESGMPSAPGDLTLDDSEVSETGMEENVSQTQSLEAEASALAEEISAESFSDTERVESESGMPIAPGDVTLDDSEVSETGIEENVPQTDSIEAEASSLAEETPPELPFDSERVESESGMPDAPGDAVQDDPDVDVSDVEDELSHADPALPGQDHVDAPAGTDSAAVQEAAMQDTVTPDTVTPDTAVQDSIGQDTVPDIVDTLDVMSAAPALREEAIPEDLGSFTGQRGEHHAVIVTDWTSDGEAHVTQDNASPK